MTGHAAVRVNTRQAAFQRLLDAPLESFELGVLQQQPHPAHATVQNVEDHSSGNDSGSGWHGDSLANAAQIVNI